VHANRTEPNRTEPNRTEPNRTEPNRTDYTLVCGDPVTADWITSTLHPFDWHLHPQATTTLVIDSPCGFALTTLAALAYTAPVIAILPLAVSPEYCADVWDSGPDALLLGATFVHEFAEAMIQVTAGQRYCSTLPPPLLSPVQRTVLRYVAQDWSDQCIATQLQVAPQTVTNRQ
jgi:DNA-binding NarL/FixJ family response regulator